MSSPRIGVLALPELRPRHLPEFAREAEAAGVDDVWVAEDCFFAGAVAAASAALAATTRITVGIGIMPAVSRNAAFTAMEIAALADLYPGRVVVGIGHGMGDWMRQIGVLPRSPLTALREHLDAVRALLAGERVTVHGDYVRLDGVELNHPPERVPPVIAGVRGPRSLELSGGHADGTMLAWPVTPAYVRHARSLVDAGRAAAGRSDGHLVVAGTPIVIDPDPARARDAMRPVVAAELSGAASRAHLEPLGIADEAAALVAASASVDELAARLPDEWIDELAVVGDVSRCAARVDALHESGVDTLLVGIGPHVPADERIGAWRGLLAALGRSAS